MSLGCCPRRNKMEKGTCLIAPAWFSLSLSLLLSLHSGHHKVSGAAPLWPGGCHGVLCHHRFRALETNRKAKQPKPTFPPLPCFFPAFITATPHLTNATPSDTDACHSSHGASPTREVLVHWHWRLPQFCNDTVSFLKVQTIYSLFFNDPWHPV